MIAIPTNIEGKPVILPEHTIRQNYENQSVKKKVANFAISLLREVDYGLKFAISHFWPSHIYHTPDQEMHWNPDSEGLYVLVHGLSGHPSIWDHHITKIKKNEKSDLFVPYVPHAGRCTLEEAAEPLLPLILNYIQTHPNCPISLIGASNGCRIISKLEGLLRKESPGTAVKVSAAAGVFFGSTWVNLAENYGIGQYFLHPATREELQFGSKKAHELLKNVVEKCPADTERSFDFFATSADLMIPCMNSSLPQLGLGEEHYVVHDYGHNSVVSGICELQIQICEKWMKEQLDKKSVLN